MSASASAATRPKDIPGSPLASERHAYNLSLYFERLPQRIANQVSLNRVRELKAKHARKALSFSEYGWLKRLYVATSPLNRAPFNVALWLAGAKGLRG